MKAFTSSVLALTLCSLTSLAFGQVTSTVTAVPAPSYNPTKSDAFSNTAGGTGALPTGQAIQGINNTAFGKLALASGRGNANAGFGVGALQVNTTGKDNAAFGFKAGNFNNIGSNNAFFGTHAGFANGPGNQNVAVGAHALAADQTGSGNTAVGFGALMQSKGGGNTAIGYGAGSESVNGVNNIYLGSFGEPNDSYTMRLGVPGVTGQSYIYGVADTSLTEPQAVLILPNGKLIVGSALPSTQGAAPSSDTQTAALLTTLMQRVEQLEARVAELEAAGQ